MVRCSSTVAACLSQMAAIGAQDTLLSCGAQSTLFMQSYNRVTNFAMGEEYHQFSNAVSGAWTAQKCLRAEVARSSDLLGPVFLDFSLGALPKPVESSPVGSIHATIWTPAVGFALINSSRIVIGSQEFETLEGEAMVMLDELDRREGHRAGLMVGDYGPYLRQAASTTSSISRGDEDTLQAGIEFSTRNRQLYVPLKHFFTKHPHDYLNKVGLQYHNIVVEVDLKAQSDLVLKLKVDRATTGKITFNDGSSPFDSATEGHISGFQLLAIGVHLDTPERKYRAQAAATKRYQYMQNQSFSTVSSDVGMRKEVRSYANHPVEQTLFAWRSSAAEQQGEFFRFGALAGSKNLLSSDPKQYAPQEVVPEFSLAELCLNSHTRFSQAPEYFLYAQSYMAGARTPTRLVYSYTFALYPMDSTMHSGSLNMSRIDNVVYGFTFKAEGAGVETIVAAVDSDASENNIDDPVSPIVMIGKTFIYHKTINFYKQSAGMLSGLFAS